MSQTIAKQVDQERVGLPEQKPANDMRKSVKNPPYILRIVRTPWKLIGFGSPIWRGDPKGNGEKGPIDEDPRSAELKVVNISRIKCLGFKRCTRVSDQERRLNLRRNKSIPLPAQFLWTLYKQKGQKALFWMYRKGLITKNFGSDSVFRRSDGFRFSLMLSLDEDRGKWIWYDVPDGNFVYFPIICYLVGNTK